MTGSVAFYDQDPRLSNRSGEPARSLTLEVRARDVNSATTCAGVQVGFAPSNNAATPATCGDAMDVPLMVLMDVEDLYQAEVMPLPGAKMSRQPPKFE